MWLCRHAMHEQVPIHLQPEEDISPAAAGVIGSCEPPGTELGFSRKAVSIFSAEPSGQVPNIVSVCCLYFLYQMVYLCIWFLRLKKDFAWLEVCSLLLLQLYTYMLIKNLKSQCSAVFQQHLISSLSRFSCDSTQLKSPYC